MKNSIEQKIFGPMIDKKLNFKSHINELCNYAFQKIGASCRLLSCPNDFDEEIIFN